MGVVAPIKNFLQTAIEGRYLFKAGLLSRRECLFKRLNVASSFCLFVVCLAGLVLGQNCSNQALHN